jgi:hypothetical protein
MCIIGDLFHWIHFDPFWIKGQEVTQLFKFSWIGKRENKNIFLWKNSDGLTNTFFFFFLSPYKDKPTE